MRSMWGSGWVLGLILTLLSAPAAAQPDTPGSSKKPYEEILERAKNHYDVLEYEEALKLYKEAYVLQPGPALLANIGLCYRKLDLYQEAIDVYQKLSKDPSLSKETRAEVEALIVQLKEASAKQEEPASTPTTLVVTDPGPEPASKPASRPALSASLPVDPPKKLSPLTRGLYTISIAAGALSALSAGTGFLLVTQAKSRAQDDIFLDGASSGALARSGRTLGTVADVLLVAALGTASVAFIRARTEKKENRKEKNVGLRASPRGLSVWLRY